MTVSVHSRPLLLILALVMATPLLLGQPSPGPGDAMAAASARVPKNVKSPVESPNVFCNGNQLSVVASNSTLGSVLAEIRRCTGAKIDAPDAAFNARLFDHLGPGPARQVLASLLSATGFDYVIGSSDSNPDRIETILLLVRATETPTTVSQDRDLSSARRAFLQMRENAKPRPAATESDLTTRAADESVAATSDKAPAAKTESGETKLADPTQAVPGQKPADPPLVPDEKASPTPAESDSTPHHTPTTEDQIANMRQLFEQRKQMMQNPTSTHPP